MGLMSGKIGSRVATRVRSGAARLVSLKRGKAVKIKQPVEDFCPESLVGLANEMDVLIFDETEAKRSALEAYGNFQNGEDGIMSLGERISYSLGLGYLREELETGQMNRIQITQAEEYRIDQEKQEFFSNTENIHALSWEDIDSERFNVLEQSILKAVRAESIPISPCNVFVETRNNKIVALKIKKTPMMAMFKLKKDCFSSIRLFSDLEVLELNMVEMTDNDLQLLKGFKYLRELDLSGRISLRDAKQFFGLCEYDLVGPIITDQGLVHLESMQGLEKLSLRGAAGVTNTGITSLKKLTSLREVDLTDTEITADGISELRATLSDCKIIWRWGDPDPVLAEEINTLLFAQNADPTEIDRIKQKIFSSESHMNQLSVKGIESSANLNNLERRVLKAIIRNKSKFLDRDSFVGDESPIVSHSYAVISSPQEADQIESLNYFPKITRLRIEGKDLSPEILARVSGLRNIKGLYLVGENISDY